MRYLRPETTLIWFGFFIKGLGWEWLSLADPNMTVVADDLEPVYYVLMFFVGTFIFLCIGAVQYIIE
jgi:hypothetical protein